MAEEERKITGVSKDALVGALISEPEGEAGAWSPQGSMSLSKASL